MQEPTVRMGRRRDYRQLLRIREERLDAFVRAHPAGERWCPAGVPVPWMESQRDLVFSLAQRDGRWITVAESGGRPVAYALCLSDDQKGEVRIEGQTPRIRPGASPEQIGAVLVQFVLARAAADGMHKACVHFHGCPDEAGPLMELYAKAGFRFGEGHYRVEMLARGFPVDPGSARVSFRTAADTGLDAFYEAEVGVGRWDSVEQSREDCEASRRIWCVDPSTDYVVAYDGEDPVGIARVALTHDGTGVVDAIQVLPDRCRQGIGRGLLARALSALEGRTDVIWLDVDSDNFPARRLYEGAGFQVHHQHGDLSIGVTKRTGAHEGERQ